MTLIDQIGRHLSGIEQLRIMLSTGRRAGLTDTLDIRLVEVDDGRIVMEATPDLYVYNPAGVAHGGFAAAILDSCCGYAVLSQMAPGQRFTTLELKVAYHRAITRDTGVVRAEGRIVTCGRRAAFAEGRLTDASGTLYASATSSLLVMSG
ncbi:PaaI family thioesterase [Longimicrobium terrae]|uniref:Uncharacterized protein (TIGR00369 family) n=1 Tax=Longimicrobium terrae TaxID=1639882 RepID=A0A841GWL4_9BACT|nr:PaaI family thioesterase [Longimicrobium terrae]MBB4634394.1 uncharacterized protein (TIGR00369 family) [Longimicrobium terrae]MBB6068716.1 uncharacterized protein (TIGR00369 family) [Longimicrobium terrae]NNC27902.1 PaaI family thioesterase [Longimicrobium terrae]